MNNLRPSVLAIFVNEKNEILIGTSPKSGGHRLPQGGIEKNETAYKALKREIKEELNINLLQKDIIKQYKEKVSYMHTRKIKDYPYKGQEQTVFKIKFNTQMNPIPQDNEFGELFWIKAKDIEKYDIRNRKPAYIKALSICGLL